MSSSRPAIDVAASRNLTLDVASFQRLLAAAWAIQCERDRIDAQSSGFEHDFYQPVTTSELLAWAEKPGTARDSVVNFPSIATKNSDLPIGPPPKLPPARAQQSCAPEIAGALALVQARNIAAPASLAVSDGMKVLRQYHSDQHPALTLLASRKQPPSTAKDPFRFLRKTPAAWLLGTILVLVAVITVVTFELWHGGVASGKVSANFSEMFRDVPTREAGIAVGNSPYLESSHSHVTDVSISSKLEDLSRYEMNTIRRQAEFGDGDAALLLAMAHEIGHEVPQSCGQAGYWVRVAAEDGNAAAQYNLALRYLYGDGISADRNEAKSWLRQSAIGGYGKAQLAVQHLSF